MDGRPIGVFDSGLGGLTVVKELQAILPAEDIVYFGDTGRVPYGTRSVETIERYAAQDIRFLERMDVKMIIAACGTVSSVAVHASDALTIPYLGVVRPASAAAVRATRNRRVGVIGTTATIRSRAFERSIAELDPAVTVFGVGCPLLVPLVENGWFSADDPIALMAAERYLAPLRERQIDTLILGCTHFPLLWDVIRRVMGDSVVLINTGCETARAAARLLQEEDRLCDPGKKRGSCRFFVSDTVDGFNRSAGIFLGYDTTEDVNRIQIDTGPSSPEEK